MNDDDRKQIEAAADLRPDPWWEAAKMFNRPTIYLIKDDDAARTLERDRDAAERALVAVKVLLEHMAIIVKPWDTAGGPLYDALDEIAAWERRQGDG